MKLNSRTTLTFAGIVASLMLTFVQAPISAQAQAGKGAKGKGKGLSRIPDPRVEQRTYHFAETDEEMPYAIFVSSKVSPDKKNPLIVALHGLGGNPNSLLHDNAIGLAEEGGYILVGPMGYNTGGWYGSLSPGDGNSKRLVQGPANLAELSEKDVMNVLEIVRGEFNVDDDRTYLMGHSMGGAGALFLGPKHASDWAAIAAIAPAARHVLANAEAALTPVKDSLPVMIAQGGADTAVSVEGTRKWAELMNELDMDYEYLEVGKADHGTIINIAMPDIFAFFKQHTKSGSR